MSKYFVKRKDKIVGTYSGAQLVSAAKSGKLAFDDEIGSCETGPWTIAGEISKLSSYFSDVDIGLSEKSNPQVNRGQPFNADQASTSPPTCVPVQTQLNPDSGNTVLIVSLIGIFIPLLGLIAWFLGSAYVRESKRHGYEPGSAGRIGKIIGMITSILWILSLVFIFLCLAYFASSVATRMGGSQYSRAAQAEIRVIKDACIAFKLNVGRFPVSLEELSSPPSGLTMAQWGGPYLETPVSNDPWQRPYIYSADDENEHVYVISVGPDGQQGTEDDIPGPTGR